MSKPSKKSAKHYFACSVGCGQVYGSFAELKVHNEGENRELHTNMPKLRKKVLETWAKKENPDLSIEFKTTTAHLPEAGNLFVTTITFGAKSVVGPFSVTEIGSLRSAAQQAYIEWQVTKGLAKKVRPNKKRSAEPSNDEPAPKRQKTGKEEPTPKKKTGKESPKKGKNGSKPAKNTPPKEEKPTEKTPQKEEKQNSTTDQEDQPKKKKKKLSPRERREAREALQASQKKQQQQSSDKPKSSTPKDKKSTAAKKPIKK